MTCDSARTCPKSEVNSTIHQSETPCVYDQVAPFYHLIFEDWDRSIARQSQRLTQLANLVLEQILQPARKPRSGKSA